MGSASFYSVEDPENGVTLRNILRFIEDIKIDYVHKGVIVSRMHLRYLDKTGAYQLTVRIDNIIVLINVQDKVIQRIWVNDEEPYTEKVLTPMGVGICIGHLDSNVIVTGKDGDYTSFEDIKKDIINIVLAFYVRDIEHIEKKWNLSKNAIKNKEFFNLVEDLKYDLDSFVRDEENKKEFLKQDAEKPRPSLVFKSMSKALNEVVKLAEFGAKKYSPDNWLKGNPTRYQDALLRHSLDRLAGEDYDKDSGMLHLVHEAWNTLALLEMKLRGTNIDITSNEIKEFFKDFEGNGK